MSTTATVSTHQSTPKVNPAIAIAEVLTKGLGLKRSADIPVKELNEAISYYDRIGLKVEKPVAGDLTQGEILNSLLAACGGQLGRRSGQFFILTTPEEAKHFEENWTVVNDLLTSTRTPEGRSFSIDARGLTPKETEQRVRESIAASHNNVVVSATN
jgi:hypothetical protein